MAGLMRFGRPLSNPIICGVCVCVGGVALRELPLLMASPLLQLNLPCVFLFTAPRFSSGVFTPVFDYNSIPVTNFKNKQLTTAN